jgi:ubiquinone/menaquinone biosynthesis C-methylase UbiE
MAGLELFILSTVVLSVLIVLGWRLLARRVSLPCPSAFIWMLENRIMENVAGSAILIERARIEPGMQVLDAGCGPGRVTIPLAKHLGPDGEVIALDVQVAMLARVAERMVESGVRNIRVQQAPLGEGALPEAFFDRALLVTVLGEIPDQQSALTEIYSALKPGGILSISEVLPDPHYQTRKTVRKLGQKLGFDIHEVFRGWRSFTFNLIKPED